MDKQVLSQKIRKIYLLSRRLAETILGGNYKSVFKGPGLEFDEVRDYLPGDDTRFIDWNVSSRMGEPYTKTFREEREMLLQVIIDVSQSSFTGPVGEQKRECAGTLFALIAHAALLNNDRVGSLLFSDRIESCISPKKGKRFVMRQLAEVLEWEPQGKGSNLALALRTASETMKRRGICFIISDFRGTNYKKELSLLSRKHDVIALRLTHILDRELPAIGLTRIIDSEQNDKVNYLGLLKGQKKAYSQYWNMEYHSWLNSCRSLGVDTLQIKLEADPADQLIAYLQNRKRRRK
ncbi:MAG: DUF58 domain-containing protein [Spirochaetaceae bacterium]|jgi:uncharacterized protein (DUF58 family)|nr:DUF58 domain-containing protein [Spirochaetaceae bacterium]